LKNRTRFIDEKTAFPFQFMRRIYSKVNA
jgi:hypothetical protein